MYVLEIVAALDRATFAARRPAALCSNGDRKAGATLLRAGTLGQNVNVADADGLTQLDIARLHNHQKVVAFLLRNGAKSPRLQLQVRGILKSNLTVKRSSEASLRLLSRDRPQHSPGSSATARSFPTHSAGRGRTAIQRLRPGSSPARSHAQCNSIVMPDPTTDMRKCVW